MGPGAFHGTLDAPASKYFGCGIPQKSAAGHQDYLLLTGGTCEETLKSGPFVDRYCGSSLDCADSVMATEIKAKGSGTVCSKSITYTRW
jgi:hypothetical protein